MEPFFKMCFYTVKLLLSLQIQAVKGLTPLRLKSCTLAG